MKYLLTSICILTATNFGLLAYGWHNMGVLADIVIAVSGCNPSTEYIQRDRIRVLEDALRAKGIEVPE